MLTVRARGHALAAALLLAPVLLTSAVSVRNGRADTVRDAQLWVLDDLRAPQAWRVSQGRGVTVAVLDSGVNPDVSDLAGSVTTGPDLTHAGTPASSPSWGEHGTWMASLIAGHGHSGGGDGILGIAPQSRILSIRVITDHDDPGHRRYQRQPPGQIQQALADAIRYAVGHRAAVISMSIGYGSPSASVRAALAYAVRRGTVIVASSGNSGDSSFARTHSYAPYSFPADYPGVLAVGAADRDGSPASFSSDNLSVQVAAPGVDVPAQGRDGQYWEVSGTSPACALVAGVAALIRARHPRLAAALVSRAIISTTRDRPARGYDDRIGFGMVDAAAALGEARVLARAVPDAGLSAGAFRGAQGVVRPGHHFGGGPSHVAQAPVRPRAAWPLALFGLFGLTSLAVAGMSLTRVLVILRARRSAAVSWPGPPLPPEALSGELSGELSGASPKALSAQVLPPPPQTLPPEVLPPPDPGTVPPSVRGLG